MIVSATGGVGKYLGIIIMTSHNLHIFMKTKARNISSSIARSLPSLSSRVATSNPCLCASAGLPLLLQPYGTRKGDCIL